MSRLAILAAASALAAGCATAGPGSEAASLAEQRRAFTAAYASSEAEAVAGFYAPNATYIGTGGDVVSGRDRLLIGLRREVPLFRDFRVEPAEFETGRRLAWERGTYRATLVVSGRPPQAVSGPYLIVYERDGSGQWLIRTHMSGRHRPPTD